MPDHTSSAVCAGSPTCEVIPPAHPPLGNPELGALALSRSQRLEYA